MTQQNKPITENEWCYLSEKGRALAEYLHSKGLDKDLAVEVAVLHLGDKVAYELE